MLPGKIYLATNLKKLRSGQFIVFRNPLDHEQILVKKIQEVRGDNFSVSSTVSWGSSSKDLGFVHKSLILGTII
ncbi:MAG: hypothetical protein KGZ30_04655 [Anaplasmataceae bacterium]|nr:hypothetical protein [Anaplasmataceae bacterium]